MFGLVSNIGLASAHEQTVTGTNGDTLTVEVNPTTGNVAHKTTVTGTNATYTAVGAASKGNGTVFANGVKVDDGGIAVVTGHINDTTTLGNGGAIDHKIVIPDK